MFSNTCTKCGNAFETKNPKRVICPNCLYPEGAMAPRKPQGRPAHSGGRPGGGGGYNRGPGGRPGGGRPGGRPGGGRPGGRPGGGRPGGRPGGGRPGGGRGGPKKLLVSPEQLAEIEKMYKAALPMPNPDIHEVIGEKIDLAPSKVFFGINLVREKMKLPKLEYPKRKLALTPEQLSAIEMLYEGFLPLPPVGVHKILAKQLKIDEWRVHVGIGLIRKNRNLPRWNEDRDDIPEEMKQPKGKKPHPDAEKKAEKKEEADKTEDKADSAESAEKEEKPKKKPAKEKAEEKPAKSSDEDEAGDEEE